jgi:hypothetical protein
MAATWAPYNPGAVKNTNLIMMFGYPHGGYLMARTTPSPDIEDDDDRCHARSCRSAAEDNAKADDPCQTHGRV